jgi:hypothetical protein
MGEVKELKQSCAFEDDFLYSLVRHQSELNPEAFGFWKHANDKHDVRMTVSMRSDYNHSSTPSVITTT